MEVFFVGQCSGDDAFVGQPVVDRMAHAIFNLIGCLFRRRTLKIAMTGPDLFRKGPEDFVIIGRRHLQCVLNDVNQRGRMLLDRAIEIRCLGKLRQAFGQ